MEVWEKSQTVDPEVRAYVQSLVNAVGGQSTLEERYAVGDDALAVLQDLLRWLKLYDDKLDRLDVKRCLADANLVKGDLLEILALWPEDAQESRAKAKLALACLQLLVPLTWPIVLEEDRTTVNHHRHTPYLQLAQVLYKRAILHFDDAPILRTAIRVALPSLALPRRERSRRDEGIIGMPLYLFRNLAMITQPQHLPSQGDENEIGRSATIEAFHRQDVFSFLLTIGSGASDEFQEQDVIVLEILFHLVKGVDAKKLLMEDQQLAKEETNELETLMRKERAMHKGYNKHAPTRHNRFGTMIWVKRDDEKVSTVSGQSSITNEAGTFQQMDSSKKWNKPKYRGKQAVETNETSDLSMHIDLSDHARQLLRGFIEDFLDSSFNPVFASLRKAIERENDRISPSHHKQYFYLISWFLTAESARRTRAQKAALSAEHSAASTSEESKYAFIAAVLDQETFVLLNRHMQRALDEKNWQDLQATLYCFTQVLLTVQAMAESGHEEDQEVAENIQNRIFYEESTHDRMVQILRGYTNQGLAYLDASTECVHVFVRMLEQYSKQNIDLQIRSKRRKRKVQRKAQDAGGNGDRQEDDAEQAAEDERDAYTAVSERKFDFARFSAKFLSQPCVNTFVALLHLYNDLSPTQLKRCHRYLYRLAFKHDLSVMLFRIDILQLLHRMVKGPQGLSLDSADFQEWEQLIQQIFRRCIKWIERQTEGEGWREAAMVEMLFSKIPNTLFYLQNGFEKVVEKRIARPPAELEVKASVEEGKRIAVAVSIMLELGKQDAVEWVKREIRRAIDERQSWEDQHAATLDAGGPEADIEPQEPPSAPSIFLSADSDERKLALFKDKHLRLLLETVGLERLGTAEDIDASWIVPSSVSAAQLKDTLDSIQKTEFDPPTFDDGKTAIDLIRSKVSARRRTAFSESESEGGEDDDIDEAMFPPNLREKRTQVDGGDDDQGRPAKKRRLTRRNRTELGEEEVEARAAERRRKERERNAKIKSQLFVTASDDESDAEADADFFRQEAERRKKTAGEIRDKLIEESQRREAGLLQKKKSKRAGKAPRSARPLESDADDDVDASGSEISNDNDVLLPLDHDEADSSGDDDDADLRDESDGHATPSTSPAAGDNVLGEVSGNVGSKPAARSATDVEGATDDDDDGPPLTKPSATAPTRRSVRAGFIIDDSDSE